MDPRTASDEALMHRLQRRRDEEAFGHLFARYRGPITSYLYRLVGNRAEAESLAQETFLRILEKSDHYTYPRRFSTWFYTIARNLATDFLKKKRAVVPDDFASLSEGVAGLAEPEAGEQVARQEELRDLGRALQALPMAYREVVVLRARQGLSYREIAAIAGCPESTARSRMDYGLEFLRQAYGMEEGEDSSETADERPA